MLGNGELLQTLEIGGSLEDKLRLLQSIRRSQASSIKLDKKLLERIFELEKNLKEVQEGFQEFEELLEQLTSPPWKIGLLVDLRKVKGHLKALVRLGMDLLLVGLHPDLDSRTLQIGQQVFLNFDGTCIIALSTHPTMGDTATYERSLDQKRILVRYQDRERVFLKATPLHRESLTKGDLLLCQPEALVALEKLPPTKGDEYFSLEIPRETFEDIGGLDEAIDQMKRQLTGHFLHGEVLQKYGQKRGKNFLLEGRPGNGKTMIAKGVANFLKEVTPQNQVRFISIKPGQLHSMWFGETERQIRDLFQAVRKASKGGAVPVVVFFDELDSLGTARGQSLQSVNDRIQTAFFSELDGFESLENTVLIGATNRRDMLDPALIRPGRFGDCILSIPQPNRKSSSDIFAKHLPLDRPYNQSQFGSPQEGQAKLIDLALGYIFDSYGESPLVAHFRDGTRRKIRPRDLLSGAIIAQVCQRGLNKACWREIRHGGQGLEKRDMLEALEEVFSDQMGALTLQNIHSYLDLPHNKEVVSLEVCDREKRGNSRNNIKGK